ncbi:hypothetical protein BDN72DRAFT_775738 [Pluteus cervinus]|uniref:Uncharacterized protein n=1 Tax=Pluteus cervinus TaxID=181527 RepID=A0ACD3AD79_9AGAR|nr:hypothetical protein BDN72DRAFT_775738 [Pluteus cervinus]
MVDVGLAEKLNELASKLLDSPGNHPRDAEHFLDANVGHSVYVARWRNAVGEARKLPGLDRFLAPKTFSEIQSAIDTLGGPVIYFNIGRFSSDALCILPNLGEVVQIPLPHLRLQEVQAISNWFGHLLDGTGNTEVQLNSPRVGKLVKDPKRSRPKSVKQYVSYPTVLKYLWRNVVKPILDGLALLSQSAEDLPRIWWCPSSVLEVFPLHAAGLYESGGGDNVMNYVVSSYIPSYSLISHVTRIEAPAPNPRFMAVGNPTGCRLPGTEWELEIIRKHLIDAGPITELNGANATPDAVKKGLQTATWAHFACHGVQVQTETINRPGPRNALILANHTRLTLIEIAKLRLPHAQFAFLSACETAQHRNICAGESVHLAAGLLVAGFRSVVGTMWRISDEDTPYLANRFYQKMVEGNKVPDYKRSAYALHDAVQALRKHNPNPRIWAPFLHYGA